MAATGNRAERLAGEGGLMGIIHVCPMVKVPEIVTSAGARHLLSLLSPETEFFRPQSILVENHLHLVMHDILGVEDGLISPGRDHVESLIDFGERWDRAAPLVVNCFAGISRSTAAAYIIAAALDPARDERELAAELRRLSPMATPNSRLIGFADDLLGRSGRMTRAIDEIGRGADAFEGVPFSLRV
jgi:predicted protein tyrosine phosphatase